jgi:class 3 adenylate cyclase/tetratricopeptide (TPR) repeat protein
MIRAMFRCLRCGTENADGAKFCNECGSPLAPAARAARRERRVVSVVFADLVGFTGKSEHMDVEDVQGFLSRYHELLRRELERHGGAVEKFIGDAVMALFGAPVAHEDDAERAVRSALSIQDAAAQMREHDGIVVHVRVGVTTGEALVALGARPESGEGMASGDVVNTAARLQAAAAVDGVLVDESTFRASGRAIVYEEADAVVAKGKTEPVAVWRAVAPRSLRPEQVRGVDLPLVGRTGEISQLVLALERSRREPSTQLVTLVGAPGIGKTRLVEELYQRIGSHPGPIRWRRGRSLAYGEGVAFWALGEMVKVEAGILESDSAEVAARKLGEAVDAVLPDDVDGGWVARHLRPLVGLEAAASVAAESTRVEAFAAWRRFFEALADGRPTVLVFEDAHWADDALLDFIDLLAERAGAIPLLIVCTARPELLERRSGWSGGKINAQTLLVSPLSTEDTSRLVGALFDQSLLPAVTQQALLARAEGNPLYAQEYGRMLRDQGFMVKDGAAWRLVEEPEALPESIQGIIAARLDTLSDDERRLIQDAAVIGKTAWIGAVCAISERSSWEAEELLHRLERRQLLRRSRRSSVEGEVEFSFAHALTQEVAYGQIRRPERAAKHERAGAWLEWLAGEREDKAELLAHHYRTALTLREQTGEDTTSLVPMVRAALAEAGRQALAVSAHAAAARHLRAALELAPADDPALPKLLLDHATAVYHAGQADEAILQAAFDAQVAVADWQAAAEAGVLLRDWVDLYAGQGERGEAVTARALEYAIRSGDAPLASLIAYAQIFRLYETGESREAIGFAEEAIRRADQAGDPQSRALLLSPYGFALITVGDQRGLRELQDASSILAHHAHPKTAITYVNLAAALIALGDLRQAEEALVHANQWAERFGLAYQIAAVRSIRAEATYYHAGDWDAAGKLSASLVGDPAAQIAAYARWSRGRMALAQGDAAVALEDAAVITDYATRSGYHEMLFNGLALSAVAHHATEDATAANQACQRFLGRWQAIGGMFAATHALAELAAISEQHDALGRASALLPDASRWKPALIAIAQHRYEDAARVYQEIGSQPLAAQGHLLAARRAAQDGRHAAAKREAEQALAFYQQVGATLYANEAGGLMRAGA